MKLSDALQTLRNGAQELRLSSGATRSEMLTRLAAVVEERAPMLLEANEADCREHEGSLEAVLYQRLKLSADKIDSLVNGMRDLAARPDPIGEIQLRTELDDGLLLERISIPLGVVAVIFESRPDVFLQVLALALRTGNGVVLKGGREATHTNRAMLAVARAALSTYPSDWFLLIEGREATQELLHYDQYIDLVIPRGSNEFVRHIQTHSTIPVLGHASGVCHIYVHKDADLEKATSIIIDAKTQYPAACNAVETVLIDSAIAKSFLPHLKNALESHSVSVRGCDVSCSLAPCASLVQGNEWSTEYGDLTLAVKVISGPQEAIDHINTFGSHHTDAIVSEDEEVCELFSRAVDSSSVFTNCSTRFADGYRYGFGAEIGIGTGKLHARGPVGIEGLLTYKYTLRGAGQVVQTYVGPHARPFRFKKL